MLGMEARNFTMGSKFGRVSDDFGIDSLKCKGDEMDIRSIVIYAKKYNSFAECSRNASYFFTFFVAIKTMVNTLF